MIGLPRDQSWFSVPAAHRDQRLAGWSIKSEYREVTSLAPLSDLSRLRESLQLDWIANLIRGSTNNVLHDHSVRGKYCDAILPKILHIHNKLDDAIFHCRKYLL
mgnify:CR=1 FL=1